VSWPSAKPQAYRSMWGWTLSPRPDNRRRDDLRAYMQRAARDQAGLADALATVEEFNARLAAGPLT
jgi:hypothetical protein